MDTQTIALIVVPLVGSLVVFVGVKFSRAGQKIDQSQEAVKAQFERMLGENRYLADQLNESRAETERVRVEGEARWDRQIKRCRRVTDAATAALTDVLRFVPPNKQQKGARMIEDLAAHIEDEHS